MRLRAIQTQTRTTTATPFSYITGRSAHPPLVLVLVLALALAGTFAAALFWPKALQLRACYLLAAPPKKVDPKAL